MKVKNYTHTQVCFSIVVGTSKDIILFQYPNFKLTYL